MVREYLHEEMNREIDAISGYYTFLKEVRLPFHDREILYILGCAIIDNSCCGVGGCGFALIPGYILSWKSRIDDQGKPVTEVEPLRDKNEQKELTRLIQDNEMVTQIQFL